MHLRKRVLLPAICLVLAVALLLLLTGDSEPQYQGRKLSQWLRTYDGHYPDQSTPSLRAQAAIREIGTNAIPYLLKWISYEPSSLKTKTLQFLERLPLPMRRHLVRSPIVSADDAEHGFFILATQANSAIPELKRLAITSSSSERAFSCTRSLAFIGPNAMPALMEIFTNANPVARSCAILVIGELGTNGLSAIPTLLKLLADADQSLGCAAEDTLGKLALCPEAVIPALMTNLSSTSAQRRACAARGLGGFGPKASAAVPQLLRMIKDPSAVASEEARHAIFKITGQTLTEAYPQ